MKVRGSRLIQGFGINDANYNVTLQENINGRWVQTWRCPYYGVWRGVIARCRSSKALAVAPTYNGCTIYEPWSSFMTFRDWMMTQDWQGKQLDKDILFEGNKHYSPETCCFVDARVNTFIIERGVDRGEYPLGVHLYKRTGKFQAICSNPFTNTKEHLGYFITPEDAHLAWLERKYTHACSLAMTQDSLKVAEALVMRYAKRLSTLSKSHF